MDDAQKPEEEKAKAASAGSGETGETESVEPAVTTPAPQIIKTAAAETKTNGQEGPGKG